MRTIATLRNLRKSYKLGSEYLQVLKGLNLEFEEGDFVALMGPSGSGKSTLMNVLGCLDRADPDSDSEYVLAGSDVAKLTDDELSEIRSKYLGFIFQSYNLLPQYTVVENIEVPLLYQGITLNEVTRERCVKLAEMVGLGERLGHRPLQLSGGQQQRVAIARALVNDPHVILADEATGNLDTKTSIEIMQLLTELNRFGKTIIMVTHENDIAEWARRVVRLRDGLVEKDERNEDPVGERTPPSEEVISSARLALEAPVS